MADHSRRDLADQHAAWFVKVARRLCGDAPPTWDHVEFMLAEEFEHGFKHGREAKPAVVGPADADDHVDACQHLHEALDAAAMLRHDGASPQRLNHIDFALADLQRRLDPEDPDPQDRR